MSAKTLYEEDFHAWALEQARVLRDLRPGAPLPNQFDLQHVAEEVEDLGNEQRAAVEGNLVQALVHLVKIALAPDDAAVPHWSGEAATFLANARRRYRPSMRRLIDERALWRDAVEIIEVQMPAAIHRAVPRTSPIGFDALVALDTRAASLIAAMQAALAPPPAAPASP